MDTFSIRDLRTRTGDLSKAAAKGEISLITSHGKPVVIALPLDDALLQSGVHVALAVRLFEQEVLSLSRAAKVAGLSMEAFLAALDQAGVSAAKQDADELEKDLAAIA